MSATVADLLPLLSLRLPALPAAAVAVSQGSATTMSNGLLSALKAAGGDGKVEISELKNLLGLVGLRTA